MKDYGNKIQHVYCLEWLYWKFSDTFSEIFKCQWIIHIYPGYLKVKKKEMNTYIFLLISFFLIFMYFNHHVCVMVLLKRHSVFLNVNKNKLTAGARRACGVHLASLDLHSRWQAPFCLRALGGGGLFIPPSIMHDNTQIHTPTTTSYETFHFYFVHFLENIKCSWINWGSVSTVTEGRGTLLVGDVEMGSNWLISELAHTSFYGDVQHSSSRLFTPADIMIWFGNVRRYKLGTATSSLYEHHFLALIIQVLSLFDLLLDQCKKRQTFAWI